MQPSLVSKVHPNHLMWILGCSSQIMSVFSHVGVFPPACPRLLKQASERNFIDHWKEVSKCNHAESYDSLCSRPYWENSFQVRHLLLEARVLIASSPYQTQLYDLSRDSSIKSQILPVPTDVSILQILGPDLSKRYIIPCFPL